MIKSFLKYIPLLAIFVLGASATLSAKSTVDNNSQAEIKTLNGAEVLDYSDYKSDIHVISRTVPVGKTYTDSNIDVLEIEIEDDEDSSSKKRLKSIDGILEHFTNLCHHSFKYLSRNILTAYTYLIPASIDRCIVFQVFRI